MKHLVVILLALAVLLVAPAGAEEEKKEPETKRSHAMRAETFKEIEKAQAATDKKDYGTAKAVLEKLLQGKLSDYERATVYSMLAAVHFDRDDYKGAAAAFRNVLAQKDIPEGMRIQTLTNLAQILVASEQYREAIAALKELYALTKNPSADAYALEAQAHYQLKDYKTCVARMVEAMQLARSQNLKLKESWLAVLRAAYYELGDYAKAVKVLEVLVAMYPRKDYWIQLAGLYGLLKEERNQLAAMEAAWDQGFLDREQEIVTLAQLMMTQGVPYKAWRVLEGGMKRGIVKEKLETLRLLGQAMALANESEKHIPVLQRAAKLASDGEMDLYLGQAYIDKGQWGDAAEALAAAVRKGLKRPGNAYLLLGTARFNQAKFAEARAAFSQAAKHDESAQGAQAWLRHVEAEEKRREYIASATSADG